MSSSEAPLAKGLSSDVNLVDKLSDNKIDEIAEQHASGTDELERFIVTTAELREIVKDVFAAARELAIERKPEAPRQ